MDSHAEWSRDMSACILITCKFLIKSFAFAGVRPCCHSKQHKATDGASPCNLMNRTSVERSALFTFMHERVASAHRYNELTAHVPGERCKKRNIVWHSVDEASDRPLLSPCIRHRVFCTKDAKHSRTADVLWLHFRRVSLSIEQCYEASWTKIKSGVLFHFISRCRHERQTLPLFTVTKRYRWCYCFGCSPAR